MGENSGRGRWLNPDEVIEAGLADTIIGMDETAKPKGVIERVKGWFKSPLKEEPSAMPLSDVNVLHLPENNCPKASIIAFEEGQNGVKGSRTKVCEDPSLEGMSVAHNAMAYADDMHNLRSQRL
jgi:hypothetical protein